MVKLIQPKMNMRPMDTKLKTRMAPSLGLLTVANVIRQQGHMVIVEDENIRRIDYDTPVDMVGITVTVDMMPHAVEIANRFRQKGIKVVAGGIHISACDDAVQQYFDVLSIGIAEKTWPDILKDYQEHHLKKIYRCQGTICGNDLVSPAYDLIKKRDYLYCNIVSTSRGCPFQCDFCYNSSGAYKNCYMNRPIEDVICDIKTIHKKHVMFIDDNFIGNPQWTWDFVKAIQPLRLKWNAAVSANIADMPDLLDAMKLSGCQSLFIGFESLNAHSISLVHKKQNRVDKFEHVVEEIHKRGIMINASFVYGLDGDDSSTFNSTLQWIIDHKIETVTSHILTPYPGTVVYNKYEKDGRILCHDLSKYDTAHVVYQPSNMTQEELYNGYIAMYKQAYSFMNILKRIPRSNPQKIPYLLFNFLYRKYGKITEKICNVVGYGTIGRIAEIVSYRR